MKRILLILLLTIAACSSRPDYNTQLNTLVSKWEDALKVAGSTAKENLSQPVTTLQEIKREAESFKVPEKALDCHNHLLKYMDFTIETFLAEMQSSDASAILALNNAKAEFNHWQSCNSSGVELSAFQIAQNDELAKATLRFLSLANEAYAAANNKNYPENISALTSANPPYLTEDLCGKSREGFGYYCHFAKSGYVLIASPLEPGKTGSIKFAVKEGPQFSSNNEEIDAWVKELTDPNSERNQKIRQEAIDNDPLNVTGIMTGDKPVALIGGKVYSEGNKVNGFTIKTIGENYVEFLDEQGNVIRKPLKKK